MDEIELLLRRAGILNEAQNYYTMFQDILRLNPNAKEGVDQAIGWARKVLRKNDRVVWFLRYWRLWALFRADVNAGTAELAKFNRKFNTNLTRNDIPAMNQLMTKLEHFMSVPVPAIQSHVFNAEKPAELLDYFAQEEQEYWDTQDESESLLQPDDNDEILIQFDDGMAWWLLDRPYCNAEGAAMGHCGNSASWKDGERLLSLRKHVQKGEKEYWYPVATFILDEDGLLGEMKGRSNNKPVKRYHKYIVELLKHHMIDGIKGGGYAPENNFNLNDLEDERTKEELIKNKPGLADFSYFYSKYGMKDMRTRRMLDAKLEQLGIDDIPSYDAAKKRFDITDFSDFGDFLAEIGDEICAELFSIANSDDDELEEYVTAQPDEEDFFDVIERLPDDLQDKVFARAGVKRLKGVENRKAIKQAVEYLKSMKDPMYQRFLDAYGSTGAGKDELRELAKERLLEYCKLGWYFDCEYVNIEYDESNIMTTDVTVYISEEDMVGIGDADIEGEGENDFAAFKVRNYGWLHIDEDYQKERRMEEGLVVRKGGKQAYGSPVVDKMFLNIEKSGIQGKPKLVDVIQAFIRLAFSPSEDDRDKYNIFDSRAADPDLKMLNELRRRAGLPLIG